MAGLAAELVHRSIPLCQALEWRALGALLMALDVDAYYLCGQKASLLNQRPFSLRTFHTPGLVSWERLHAGATAPGRHNRSSSSTTAPTPCSRGMHWP